MDKVRFLQSTRNFAIFLNAEIKLVLIAAIMLKMCQNHSVFILVRD